MVYEGIAGRTYRPAKLQPWQMPDVQYNTHQTLALDALEICLLAEGVKASSALELGQSGI
jgi:hypothetical protein